MADGTTQEKLSSKIEAGRNIEVADLQAQTDLQLREFGKDLKQKIQELKSQRENSTIPEEKYARQMDALLKVANDLYNIKRAIDKKRS